MAESRFEIYPQTRRIGEVEPGGAFVDTEATGEFGWRFRAADGRVIARSAGGYQTEDIAEREIGVFLESLDAFDWSGDVVKPPVLRLAAPTS
jgi:hypothetical protein